MAGHPSSLGWVLGFFVGAALGFFVGAALGFFVGAALGFGIHLVAECEGYNPGGEQQGEC